jgi:hypothetical protein
MKTSDNAPINHVYMVNAEDTTKIAMIGYFVIVIKDGRGNTAIFHILVPVHLIHFVLVSPQAIDQSAFVHWINLVLDVLFIILSVNQTEMIPVLMVVSVYLPMNIHHQIKNYFVFVRKVLLDINVK